MKKQNSRPTTKDIARMAGVGVGTVSRVVNQPENVSEKLRTRVQQVIKDTNYRPSAAARMLVQQRHQAIGVVAEIEQSRTYYSTGLLQGIATALGKRGQHLALAMIETESKARVLREIPMLSSHSVDGLILDLHMLRGDVEGVLSSLDLPCIMVNCSDSRPTNAVRSDDVTAGRTATHYLLERGHRRIAYLPFPPEGLHSSHADRMRGYLEALSEFEATTHLLWRTDKKKTMREELLAFIRSGGTAVVTYGGGHATDVLRICYESGLRVPDDVSLVACDDDPIIARAIVPVTCMRLDRREIGRLAVEMILERCANNGADLATCVVTPELQERQSVARI
jgi:DNA-binding LacI/PurR family transcriptional regulator